MYLILTEFKICTTSYGLSFFLFAYHVAINQHKKKRIHNLQYGRRNEVSKIFIISLRLIRRTGKESFKFSKHHRRIWPAKLTNHKVFTN